MIVSPAAGLLALDLWDAGADAAASAMLGIAMPGPGSATIIPVGTVLRTGPRRWWIDGTHCDHAALQGTGVVTAIGGGWTRVRLVGAQWRDLIMHSGLIDVESADFGPGSVAISLLWHVRCVLHVLPDDSCDVFVPASYTEHCLSHWRDLGWSEAA